MKLYYYNLDGSYVEQRETQLNQGIRAAINGYKGYGFYDGYFIAKQLVNIMNKEQEKKHFDRWLSKNINRIMKETKAKYKEWCDDCWQDATLYVYNCMLSDRGVNDPENSVTFKYKATLTDSARKRATKRKHESPDIEIYDEDFGMTRSYIGAFAMESLTMDTEDRCTIDLNKTELMDTLINKMMEHFDRHQINVWCNYYMFDAGVRKRGAKFGYAGTAERCGMSKSGVRDIVKLLDSKIEELEIKEFVLEVFEKAKYKTFDEYELSDLMNDKD